MGDSKEIYVEHKIDKLSKWLEDQINAYDKLLTKFDVDRSLGNAADSIRLANYWFSKLAYQSVLDKLLCLKGK